MKADDATLPFPGTPRLLVGAAVVVPLIILLLAGWLGHRNIQSEAMARASKSAQALAAYVVSTIKSQEQVIDAVSAYAAAGGWDSPKAHEFLQLAARRRNGADAITLASADGPYFSTAANQSRGMIAGDRAAVTAARDNDSLHFTPTSNRSGEATFNIARRLAGVNDAVLVITLGPEHFTSLHTTLVEDPKDSLELVRSGGELLFITPSGESSSSATRQAAQDGTNSGLVNDAVRGIVAFEKLDQYPLYLGYVHTQSAIWATWMRAMSGYAIIALCASAALFAAAILSRRRARREWAEAATRAREAAQRSAAEQVNRSKDDFLTALNHELRSPLSAIAASVEVLGRMAIPDLRGQQALLIIGRQLDKLKRLLSDLLDTSRAIYGELRMEFRPVDLLELARNVLATRPHFFKGDVRIELGGDSVWAQADPSRARQMLESLLENAQKFGGKHIRIDVSEEEQWAKFTVTDDGEGIRQDLLPRLFEPFMLGERAISAGGNQGPGETFNRSQGGLGLGLSLVQRLALLQNGSVTAFSEGRGRGSTFTACRLLSFFELALNTWPIPPWPIRDSRRRCPSRPPTKGHCRPPRRIVGPEGSTATPIAITAGLLPVPSMGAPLRGWFDEGGGRRWAMIPASPMASAPLHHPVVARSRDLPVGRGKKCGATAGRGSSPPPNRGNPSPVWKKSGIASQAPENFYRVWGGDLSAVALAKEDAPQAPANSKELPVAPARSGACSRSARPPSGRHAAPARPVRRSLGEGGPTLTWPTSLDWKENAEPDEVAPERRVVVACAGQRTVPKSVSF